MRRAPPIVAALVSAAALVLTSCSGDDSAPVSEDKSPEEVMELAKTTLDETSGVSISLATDNLPDGVNGVEKASGVGTHDPAFEGDITVALAGTTVDVPVVAVDGEVYAELPLTTSYQPVDPGEYGAPDPAQLMDTEAGFSSLLTETSGLEEGDTVRGGADNTEILTEFTGTVPGSSVETVIPSASGDFDVTYTITADGELREAVITGTFYPESEEMTYTVGFDDYGTEQDITAP